MKDEVYRVASRHALPVVVVAQGFIRVPDDPLIERVAAGDKRRMPPTTGSCSMRTSNSIVVTSDIPLASRAVKAGAVAIAPDGRVFTEEAIGMALAMRDLMTDLRSAGGVTGGPRPFSKRDRSEFLSALDTAIRRLQRAAS